MRYYLVDAFAEKAFTGNQAGVCILTEEIPDQLMQKIAFENNLAETAFLLQRGDYYKLHWFTPDVEIDLCGHATLATAHVVMTELKPGMKEIVFDTMSGPIAVYKEESFYMMNLPNRLPRPIDTPKRLSDALGCEVLGTYLSRDMVAEVSSEREVQNMVPDMNLLCSICADLEFGIVVTARGDSCDFVSRFFAPAATIKEDPVTGSSHSSLVPYWSRKLNKRKLVAKQLSRRGGTLHCEDCGDIIKVGGTAVIFSKGEIMVNESAD